MIPYFSIPPLEIPLPFGASLLGTDHLTIQPFGFLVACGVLFGNWQAMRFARKHELDMEPLHRMIVPMLVVGFIGAHLLAVGLYRPEDFAKDWWKLSRGLSSYGGIFSALLTLVIWTRWQKIRLSTYADSLGFGFLHGWVLGRTACSVAHDHIGRLTTFPLAIQFPEWHRAAGQRFDLGLLELLYTLVLVALVYAFLGEKGGKRGILAAWLGLLYAPARFFLDFLRATDITGADRRYYGLTPAQYCCVLLAIFCIWWLGQAKAEQKGKS